MKKYLLLALCCLMGLTSAMAQNGLAADGWYEYTVSEGNLSELIPETEKYQITKLRLKGKINGDDFRLIREMAGLIGLLETSDGELRCLDISNVEICGGGYYIDGQGPLQAKAIGDYMFCGSKTLKEISLGNVIKTGYQAFCNCENLINVSGTDDLIEIGSNSFSLCPSLSEISLPKVEKIGSGSFSDCFSLKSIYMPNVKKIETSTFARCTSLVTISLPEVQILGQSSLSGCKALKSIECPNVKTISHNVFQGCESLESIYLPNVTGEIGQYAFSDCKSLKAIDIRNIIDIGQYAFFRCESLKAIEFPNVSEIPMGAFLECESLESIDFPKVTIIESSAFMGCKELGKASLENVIKIGTSAFSGCSSLQSVNMPNVVNIGSAAFTGCDLQQLNLPYIQEIGESTFSGCNFSVINIGENLRKVGFSAFPDVEIIYLKAKNPPMLTDDPKFQYNNQGLGFTEKTTIIVPESTLSSYHTAEYWREFRTQIISEDMQTYFSCQVEAQESTSGLLNAISEEQLNHVMHLTLKGSINGYDIMILRNKMPNLHYLDLTLTTIKANPYEYYQGFHSEDHRISGYMFHGLNKLIEIKLPNSISYIGENAFSACKNLKNVTMCKGITNIDSRAFYGCKSLKKQIIPAGVLTINDYAFEYCSKLDTLIIEEGTRVLKKNCYDGCSNLRYVNLPNSLEEIAISCFDGCPILEINLPKGLKTIGQWAFRGNKIRKLILPSSLREIGNEAFKNGSELSDIYISPMIETIGNGAFRECPKIENIYNYIANAKDIKIDQNTFDSWSTASLHVPKFAYNSYYWDTQWSQFAHLDEFDEKYESFYSKNTITLDKNTGTITGTPDATLHENGGLIVNDEEKQELDEIQLKSDGTNGATLIPENSGNITAKKVDITIKVTANKWHFFCFPFDVPLSGMTYEGEYVWRRYDGAKRSRREGGWQNLAAGTTELEAGRGYIFQGTTSGELTLSVDNPEITASDVKTGLEVHPSDNSQDASWNFVGNPYVSYYSIDATTYSSPITVWNGNGYEAYRPGDDDYMFHPYQAFFVQTPVDASEIGFDATARESFEQSQTSLASAKARRAARKMNVNRLLANLELFAAGDTTYMDKTRIVFNDKENMEYDAVSDAAKFMSSERAAEFYTMDSKNVQYAINERPMASGDVRMGFIANKAGEYRIAQSRSDVEMLLVDHQEGITHNLGTGAYAFSSGEGTFENRFTLKVNGQETGITELKEKTGIDLTVDGALCINGAAEEVTTTVYQLNGVLAGTIQGNGSLRLPKGVYAVKVGLLTLKVQI